jgi:hypothetical protein
MYEQFFLLKYYGNWSLTEAYSLPVVVRRMFVRRLEKQLKDEADALDKAQNK